MPVKVGFRHPFAERNGIYMYGKGHDGEPHAIIPRSLVKQADKESNTLLFEVESWSMEGPFLVLGFKGGVMWIPREEILTFGTA
jgi:hypothetical protein